MEFKNGCTLSFPDNVTVVFASAAEESDELEGVMEGDQVTAANLTLQMFVKLYNDLEDVYKAQFIHEFVEIIQSNLPKNMQISSVTVRKGVSPEADND